MKRFIGCVVFGIALISAGSLQAQDRGNRDNNQPQRSGTSENQQSTTTSPRYYDRKNKDWHSWDSNESNYYQRYQQQNPRYNDRDFGKLKQSQQDQYFKWRHQQHDDNR